MPVEPLGKHPLAGGDGLLATHLVKAGIAPRELVALYDEGRVVLVETVAVRLEHPVLVLNEVEGKSLEFVCCPQPDEFRRTSFQFGTKELRVLAADAAVDSIGSNNQVVVFRFRRRVPGALRRDAACCVSTMQRRRAALGNIADLSVETKLDA